MSNINEITKNLLSRRTQALLDIERDSNTAYRAFEANKAGKMDDKKTLEVLEQCIANIRSTVFNATTTAFGLE